MKCPKCGLYNPEEAIKCDCGYDFATGIEPEDAKAKRFAKRGAAIGAVSGGIIAVAIDSLRRGGASSPDAVSAMIDSAGLIAGSLLGRVLGESLVRRDVGHGHRS